MFLTHQTIKNTFYSLRLCVRSEFSGNLLLFFLVLRLRRDYKASVFIVNQLRQYILCLEKAER